MNDDHLEPRLTRTAVLRLAGAGAAGLALGVPPARAAPTDAAAVETAARAFLASLSPVDRDRASFPFAGAERTRWHWTVPASVPRNGLPLGAMSAGQRRLALALLRSSSSPAGFRKSLDIMALQGVLQRMNTGLSDPFDPDRYYVSVFGTPGARAWGWRFEGHHLSRHFTVVGGTLVTEPFFLGAWPTRAASAYRSVARGHRTMRREEDAAREIVLSLDGRLRRQVVFSSESLTDHLTQNAVRVSPLGRVGVLTGDLPSAAQRRVLEILRTYLANHPLALARAAQARIERAGIGRTRFGWAGSTRPGVPHYYRLQGPTFLLEFDNSRNSGTHIHSVWRDFERDFGRHLL
ncbi:MAG TPA: DUF3500 domain-containing protein [Gaiella sp.]|uniref:DUF3500 domain-containing protein n=1 Tax=Gaiella sp. TaxID=2663207 RepID=UPI002D8108F6|nr:DUF3500 domain-containing protein [Gaiella sp.]HET9289047.1 DUF3500 domain-containing protein [Gaiella sp.]